MLSAGDDSQSSVQSFGTNARVVSCFRQPSLTLRSPKSIQSPWVDFLFVREMFPRLYFQQCETRTLPLSRPLASSFSRAYDCGKHRCSCAHEPWAWPEPAFHRFCVFKAVHPTPYTINLPLQGNKAIEPCITARSPSAMFRCSDHQSSHNTSGPIVDLLYAQYRRSTVSRIITFLGIRYTAPPIGANVPPLLVHTDFYPLTYTFPPDIFRFVELPISSTTSGVQSDTERYRIPPQYYQSEIGLADTSSLGPALPKRESDPMPTNTSGGRTYLQVWLHGGG